ncbi:hypothetical protein YC2023_117794 [Brassica napus]
MTIPQVLSGDLKAGQCRKTVVTRVLRFWEARNVKKGGDLMGGGNHRSDDMPGAGLVSTNPSDRMIRDASDKTTAEVVEGSKADPPLATGAAVSVGYVRLKDPPTEDVRERKKPCIS